MNRNTAIKRKEIRVLHKVMTASSITYFYHPEIQITERVPMVTGPLRVPWTFDPILKSLKHLKQCVEKPTKVTSNKLLILLSNLLAFPCKVKGEFDIISSIAVVHVLFVHNTIILLIRYTRISLIVSQMVRNVKHSQFCIKLYGKLHWIIAHNNPRMDCIHNIIPNGGSTCMAQW